MLELWILTLVILSSNYQNSPAIATVKYTSEARCEAAAEKMKRTVAAVPAKEYAVHSRIFIHTCTRK